MPWKNSTTLVGRDSVSACSTRLCSSRLFCTINCARSPTTLLLGVTCSKRGHWCDTLHIGHLDDVTHGPVGSSIGVLDPLPLLPQSQGGRLELEVAVLPARHLVRVDLAAARLEAGLKGRVEQATLLPKAIQRCATGA